MYEIISDALVDTLKMVPLMVIIFTLIEIMEHKLGSSFKPVIMKSKSIGPVIGSFLGILPQCGFSVVSTLLYAQDMITTGTLVSVYLATSDEAIPVILSQPGRANIVLPLVFTKLLIAVCAGYMVDILFLIINKRRATNMKNVLDADMEYTHSGCCGSTCIDDGFKLTEVLKHSILHSFKILGYLLLVSIALNTTVFMIGEENLSKVFLTNSVFQPVLTSAIGLIPNCAASVAITEIFLKGGISFGSAISGLSACAGLGIIVLFREVKNKRNALVIIFLLLLFSITSGIMLNSVLPSNYLL